MAQKESTTAMPVEEKDQLWSTKSQVLLPIYLIMVVVLIVAMALGKLPTNMIGPIAILLFLGTIPFHRQQNSNRQSYLGGGSVLRSFASAAIATFGIFTC